MHRSYVKIWQTYTNLVLQLQTRGMLISDVTLAEKHLERHGYYRLSGYWYPMRAPGETADIRLDQFKPQARFEDVMELYVWDKKLRLLIMDAVERLEIAIRTAIAHEMGKRGGPFAHLQPHTAGFKSDHMREFGSFLSKQMHVENRSKDDFIRHHRQEYGICLPIWAAVEVWDFGTIDMFYGMLGLPAQNAISREFLLKPDTFASWLESMRHVRNICAHHSRLWNKSLVSNPRRPHPGECPDIDHAFAPASLKRLYPVLCVFAALIRKTHPASGWRTRMKAHLQAFPASPHFSPASTGLTTNWERETIWN